MATVPANAAYTAIVRGTNDGTGIAVVEVYDIVHTVDSKLGNISTRGLVGTGNNVMIAGTIVLGQNTQHVLIRAIGPSLAAFFDGVLADPILELRDANGALILGNDNWHDDPARHSDHGYGHTADQRLGVGHRCRFACGRRGLHRDCPRC